MANDFIQLRTPEGRVLFPELFTPRAIEGSTKRRYSITLLIPKNLDAAADAEMSALKSAVEERVKQKFPSFPKGLGLPIQDGDKLYDSRDEGQDYYESYRGMWVVKASLNELKIDGVTQNPPPPVVDGNKHAITDPTRVYSGCYGRAVVMLSDYDKSGNRGVKFILRAVQITHDGDPLGGPAPADLFDTVAQPLEAPAVETTEASNPGLF